MNSNFWGDKYGFDKFSKFLALISVVFLLSRGFSKLIGVGILGYALWRAFSKDKYKRRREELAYEDWMRSLNYRINRLMKGDFASKIKNKFNGLVKGVKERKDFVIVKCPNCSQKLRLPRGKGNLIVTCKKCSHEFKKRT